jgi:hypothetical protein
VIFCIGAIATLSGIILRITYSSGQSTGALSVICGVVEICFGVLIMKGFPPFVDIAFPAENQPEQAKITDDNNTSA